MANEITNAKSLTQKYASFVSESAMLKAIAAQLG